MNIISVENITKSFTERTLLNDISLNIADNDKIGLIGINGTGKSTFLNIVAGKEQPESGLLKFPRGITVEYLPQNPEFDPEKNVLDQVIQGNSPAMQAIKDYETILEKLNCEPENKALQDILLQSTARITALDAWYLESQIKTILTKLDINEFTSLMGTLSGGLKKRVALARALISPCDLLILDEPTNHMDNQTIDWLEKYLRDRSGALLMVTHDRYFLDRVVNKIIELDNGKLYTYTGSYSLFLDKKSERKALISAAEAKKQSLYKKELEWIRTGAKARSTKQKARINRFDELQKSRNLTEETKLDIATGHSRLGKKTIIIDNISKQFNCKQIIKDFSYILLRDDRIGIIGPNGIGKSTLFNILSGQIQVDNGSIDIGSTVKIGYLSQESEDMPPESRAIEYIKNTAEYITTPEGNKISAAQMMERFLFPLDLQWVPIAKLSGGEKRRLYLLKILMTAPNVLLLDEPTNDLDLDTLKVLEDYIDQFKGAVISISHDRYFLDRTCYRIFSFEGNGMIVEHMGSYSDYLEYKEACADRLEHVKDNRSQQLKQNWKDKPAKLKFTFKEQQEYKTIDADIEALENQIARLDSEMTQNPSDFIKLQELAQKKELLENQLLYRLERQEYLSNLEKQIQNQ